jgi:hypothetical protein
LPIVPDKKRPLASSGRLLSSLEHDPEKWKPVFHATNAKRVCAQIMLKQRD